MSSDVFVTIRYVSDSVEAEMLRDLLESEGIAALIPSSQGALLGRASSRAPVQVRRSDVERAERILDALVEYDSVEPVDSPTAPAEAEMTSGDGPYRSAAAEAPTPRKKSVAVAAAVVLPLVLGAFGAGHLYARAYARGLVLLALAWGCIAAAIAGHGWALLGVLLVIAADVLGATHWIQAQSRELTARDRAPRRPPQR